MGKKGEKKMQHREDAKCCVHASTFDPQQGGQVRGQISRPCKNAAELDLKILMN